jgi:hypothetical protein
MVYKTAMLSIRQTAWHSYCVTIINQFLGKRKVPDFFDLIESSAI